MSFTSKLFSYKDIYDTEGSEDLFVSAMKENCIHHAANCPGYKKILDKFSFDPSTISSFDDVVKIPFIPTLYLKHHDLQSVPLRKQLIKATSSGTSGKMSKVSLDLKTVLDGAKMVINVGKYHKLWSIKPVNYIVFGYQPTKSNQTAVSKTALGFTFFAPAKSRTFALEAGEGGYKLSWDKVLAAMKRCSESSFPMRTIGFPAYTYFLLRDMKEKGIKYQMPKGSMVTLGGGWKQFYTEKVEKEEFYALVKEVLGIDEDHIVEFFGAVEHPILYTDCKCHHFHVPVYSRVVIRDPDTFLPLPDGQAGLVNLMTPMMHATPVTSIMTDDLGVLHSEGCPCGAKSPWLEIIGRVGVGDIVTCAAGADEYLKGTDK